MVFFFLFVQVESIEESSVPSDAISLSDPVAGLEPKVQKDVLVFINLVEFSKYVHMFYAQ